MAYLIAGQHEKLEGPLGEAFIQAIRLRWSSQLGETASIEEISEHFQQYDISQLEGATNTIKGKSSRSGQHRSKDRRIYSGDQIKRKVRKIIR